jgi:hypothetical protein
MMTDNGSIETKQVMKQMLRVPKSGRVGRTRFRKLNPAMISITNAAINPAGHPRGYIFSYLYTGLPMGGATLAV